MAIGDTLSGIREGLGHLSECHGICRFRRSCRTVEVAQSLAVGRGVDPMGSLPVSGTKRKVACTLWASESLGSLVDGESSGQRNRCKTPRKGY